MNAVLSRVNAWKQSGVLYVWRYIEPAKNFPGWHLAFDRAGLASVTDLLRRLVEDDGESPLLRSARVTTPTSDVLAIPNNGRAPSHSPELLRIIRLPTTDEWIVAESGVHLVLSIGRTQMLKFIAWLAAEGDSFDTTFGSGPGFWHWGTVDRQAPHRAG